MKVFARIQIPSLMLHRWLIVLGGTYVVNILTQGWLTQTLALIPAAVADGQWWRLMSFPLAIRNGFEMAVIGAVFYGFGQSIEQQFRRNRLWRFALLLLVTQGWVYQLLLFQTSFSLESPIVLPLALFTWFTLRQPQQRDSFLGWIALKRWQWWGIIMGVSIVPLLQTIVQDPLALLHLLAVHGLALLAGTLAVAVMSTPSLQNLSSKQTNVAITERTLSETEEDELNRLLDKIAASGYHSLSWREKQRLRQLSRRL